jgi:ankyrin repeat protein
LAFYSREIVKTLLQFKADINKTRTKTITNKLHNKTITETALHIALEKGDDSLGQLILNQKEIDVEIHRITTEHGVIIQEPPLYLACSLNKLAMVNKLLKANANVNNYATSTKR